MSDCTARPKFSSRRRARIPTRELFTTLYGSSMFCHNAPTAVEDERKFVRELVGTRADTVELMAGKRAASRRSYSALHLAEQDSDDDAHSPRKRRQSGGGAAARRPLFIDLTVDDSSSSASDMSVADSSLHEEVAQAPDNAVSPGVVGRVVDLTIDSPAASVDDSVDSPTEEAIEVADPLQYTRVCLQDMDFEAHYDKETEFDQPPEYMFDKAILLTAQ